MRGRGMGRTDLRPSIVIGIISVSQSTYPCVIFGETPSLLSVPFGNAS